MKRALGLALLLILLSLVPACAQGPDLGSQIGRIVGPYEFNTLRWEINTLSGQAAKLLTGAYQSKTDAARVVDYFASMRRAADLRPVLTAVRNGDIAGNADLLGLELSTLQGGTDSNVGAVESIIANQIHEVLTSQGIFNPLYDSTRLGVAFPPVSLKIEKPIHLLVVSRRDRIGSIKRVILKPDLSVADMERIEDETDSLDVSSLVVELGGTAVTYPTFVSNRGSLRYTLDAAAEEWVHQYLAFKPLGFRYVLNLLGVNHDPDIPVMNETVAGMVSREIGGMVYRQYYQDLDKTPAHRTTSGFNDEVREIRRHVEILLAAGQIDQAEQFMKDQRQHLAAGGFYLRKLNQAYFAFYGNYVTSPGATIAPIGDEFDKLRAQSQSLADFLEKAASLTDHRQLENLIR